ncbi:GNAT family N-acetyltransferase [Streptomyces cavernae]|uniref:GNAT family N-acetyltransferase n=1 Tax=Streptomyces cavernae TaxID=2259034 RepID=UPI000FEBA390|nr:GNAT family N-acetyltransferase [Streptomyces cavernae]
MLSMHGRDMGGDQVTEAVAGAVALLRPVAGRDWSVPAGSLEWSVRQTVEHIADDLVKYAGRLAVCARDRRAGFELKVEDETDNEGLLQMVEMTAALLAATVRSAPPRARAFHPYPFGSADRTGFAAMGVAEVLLHTYDAAAGLGLAYEPPGDLCTAVLTRLFPHVRPGADPWQTLLWATGRTALPDRPRLTEWRWSNNLVIPAERLTLTGLTPASAAELAAGGTGGFEWVEGGPYEGTREAAGMLVKAYEAGVHRPEWGVFVLVREEDGRAVGGMGFHGPPGEEDRAEIGYDLAEAARGHGYATEALRALSAWALARDDVKSLFAVVDRTNLPSQAVVSRAGFTRVSADGERFAYELRG